MDELAYFEGSFWEWQQVVTRGVLHLTVCVPEADAQRVLAALGFPMPGKVVYAAIQAELSDGGHSEPVLTTVHKSLTPWKALKAVKVVLEVDSTQAQSALEILGMPSSVMSIPVVVARVSSEAAREFQPPEWAARQAEGIDPQKPKGISNAQRAGILCGEIEFRKFLAAVAMEYTWPDAIEIDPDQLESAERIAHDTQVGTPLQAAEIVRIICAVKSRSEFDSDPDAGARWKHIADLYEATKPKFNPFARVSP
jgi:hypothetical protein